MADEDRKLTRYTNTINNFESMKKEIEDKIIEKEKAKFI